MENPLTVFAWTLAGACAFAALGALFGALAGGLAWRNGQASGSFLGNRAAEALVRLLENRPAPVVRAALIGAADGALFLGLVGTLIGLVAGYRGDVPSVWLLPAFGITAALIGGAVGFGILAYLLVRLSMKALVGVFCGGMGGALLTARYVGVAHIVPGAVAGILLGALASLAFLRRRS